jgi:hypothetical protein
MTHRTPLGPPAGGYPCDLGLSAPLGEQGSDIAEVEASCGRGAGLSTKRGDWVHSGVKKLVLLGAIAALPGCAATSNTATLPARDHGETVARLPLGHNAGEDPAAVIPHGAEISSGHLRLISAGNLHLMVGPDATVVRTAHGVTVVSHGKTRTFPSDATITDGGVYHNYAALRK